MGIASLGFYFIVTEMRADWPAMVKPLGFRYHGHTLAPCAFCWSPNSDLHDYDECDVDNFPYPLVTDADIAQEIKKCEARPLSSVCYIFVRFAR